MANDNLSGVVVAATLARLLAERDLRYTWRFLFCPATVGSIAWLAGTHVVPRLRHGLACVSVGDPGPLTYKPSRRPSRGRQGRARRPAPSRRRPPRAALRSLGLRRARQFTSPGYDVPMGALMRTPPGSFPENHTSADDLDLVRPEVLADSLAAYIEVVDVLERNRTLSSLAPFGEPQLGRRGLFRTSGGAGMGRGQRRAGAALGAQPGRRGGSSLLDIAVRAGLPFGIIDQAAARSSSAPDCCRRPPGMPMDGRIPVLSVAADPVSTLPPRPKLQRPPLVWVGGALAPWEDASLHLSTEAFQRGVSVFEGLKGHRQPDDPLGPLLCDCHFRRLEQSARLLHLPMPVDLAGFHAACIALTGALQVPGRDVYARATVLAVEGHWGEGTVSDLVVLAYQQEAHGPAPVDLGVSTWRRSHDLALPARIKTGTNYQVGRLARIEGRARAMDEMILLNDAGRVAESTAACAPTAVRDGRVIAPPPWRWPSRASRSRWSSARAPSCSISFERRPVERTERPVADEIGLCGTLAEITRVRSIEGAALDPAWPVLGRVLDRYRDAVRGIEPLPGVEVTLVPLPGHDEPRPVAATPPTAHPDGAPTKESSASSTSSTSSPTTPSGARASTREASSCARRPPPRARSATSPSSWPARPSSRSTPRRPTPPPGRGFAALLADLKPRFIHHPRPRTSSGPPWSSSAGPRADLFDVPRLRTVHSIRVPRPRVSPRRSTRTATPGAGAGRRSAS